MGELASVAGRSTNKVSELGGYTPRSPGGELDTFGIRSGSEGTQLTSVANRLSGSQEKDSQKKVCSLDVFNLSSGFGKISLSNELINAFTQGIDAEGIRSDAKLLVSLQSGIISKIAKNTIYKKSLSSENSKKKISKYFETHYKYSYAIRTSQNLQLEYLRLPQSSIQKNE